MYMGRHKLVIHTVLFESLLQISRCLVVKDVDLWLVAAFHKTFMDINPTPLYLGSDFAFERAVEDAIAVLVIHNEEVLVTTGGAMRKTTS